MRLHTLSFLLYIMSSRNGGGEYRFLLLGEHWVSEEGNIWKQAGFFKTIINIERICLQTTKGRVIPITNMTSRLLFRQAKGITWPGVMAWPQPSVDMSTRSHCTFVVARPHYVHLFVMLESYLFMV